MSSRASAKAATRERLIAAGLDLVRDRGFAVSVDELAKAAGLTKGAIYSNFGDRSELIAAISERLNHDLDIEMDLTKPTLAESVRDLGHQMAAMVDDERGRFILTLDYVVQLLRDDALRERAMPRAEFLANRVELQTGEWLGSYQPPIPGDDFNTVLNSVGTGLAIYRALYGRDVVNDDLVNWVFDRMSSLDTGVAPEKVAATKKPGKSAK